MYVCARVFSQTLKCEISSFLGDGQDHGVVHTSSSAQIVRNIAGGHVYRLLAKSCSETHPETPYRSMDYPFPFDPRSGEASHGVSVRSSGSVS